MLNIVKNTTFPSLLDLLAPHSCRGCGRIGTVLCDCCKKHIVATHHDFCETQKSDKTSIIHQNHKPPIYALGERSGLLDALVHDYKYHSVRAIASVFAELLDATLPPTSELSSRGKVILVPVPTATHHIRARGLDHTYLIARHLARLRGYQVQRLLIRIKNTVQVGANRKSRLAQAEAAFAINPTISIDNSATYLLLDDVWTTGASIRACLAKLEAAGAKNLAVSLLAVSKI